ncbi:MAG: acetyl-CoA carboxylase biotin carboxyl carrier protein, partial [Sphingomonas sp.]
MTDKHDNSMRVDVDLVRQLAEMLDSTGLTEVEVEDGDRKIRIARKVEAAPAVHYAPAPPAAPAQVAAAPSAEPAAAASPAAAHANAVKSPMVGTAYLSPEPGSKQFVDVGDSVKAGQPIAELDDSAQQAALRQAQAAYDAAQSQIPQAQTNLSYSQA